MRAVITTERDSKKSEFDRRIASAAAAKKMPPRLFQFCS